MKLFKCMPLALALLLCAEARADQPGIGIFPTFQVHVTPLQTGNFEVNVVGSSVALAYWCGIGDYAIRTLGTESTRRIYLSKPYEPGIRTVEFSLDPQVEPDTTSKHSITVKYVGENYSASKAESYCYDAVLDIRMKK